MHPQAMPAATPLVVLFAAAVPVLAKGDGDDYYTEFAFNLFSDIAPYASP
jgi:hypothetical protein